MVRLEISNVQVLSISSARYGLSGLLSSQAAYDTL